MANPDRELSATVKGSFTSPLTYEERLIREHHHEEYDHEQRYVELDLAAYLK